MLREIENSVNAGALQHWLERCHRYLQVEALRDNPIVCAPRYELPQESWSKQLARIEQIAQDERHRLNLGTEPLIDLAPVLEQAGLRAFGADLPPDDLDGGLVRFQRHDSSAQEAYFAIINRAKPPLRQQFTLACTYGSFLLHRHRDTVWFRSVSDPRSQEEREANAFATAFLMPKELIDRLYDEYRLPRKREQLPLFGWLTLRRRLHICTQALAWRLFHLRYVSESERDWILAEGAMYLAEMERALLGENQEPPPVPTLSDRMRTLILQAYREEKLTAENAAELLELILTPAQEHLIAQRMNAKQAKQFRNSLEQ